MRAPTIVCCFPYFREPGSGELTGGLLSSYHLVRALSSFASVRVLSLDRQAPAREHAETFGYLTRSCPRPWWTRGRAYFKWRVFLRQVFDEAIAEWGTPDVVVVTTSAMPVLGMAGRAKTVAMLQAYENFGWRVPGGRLAERWQGLRLDALSGFKNRRLIGQADLVLANSRFMAAQVSRVFGTARVSVLYPCLDLEWRDVLSPIPAPGGSGRPRVGFVNRTAGKNLGFVVELAQRMPDVDFLVYGPPSVDAASAPNVLFRGWESDRAVMFGSAPLWIVPSRWKEPFGRVGPEAQALGCCVLVAESGGLQESVGGADRVIESLDPAVWVKAIRDVQARPLADGEREALSRQMTAMFGKDAHDSRVRSLFTSLVSSP